MSTKHTPGPWSAFIKNRTVAIDIGPQATGKRPCVVDWAGFDASDLPLTAQKANAKLIAAAPENYACNKELAKIVRELCTAYGHPLPAASLDRSDAAIAKATGDKA